MNENPCPAAPRDAPAALEVTHHCGFLYVIYAHSWTVLGMWMVQVFQRVWAVLCLVLTMDLCNVAILA